MDCPIERSESTSMWKSRCRSFYRMGWDCVGKPLLESEVLLKTSCYCLSNFLLLRSQPV